MQYGYEDEETSTWRLRWLNFERKNLELHQKPLLFSDGYYGENSYFAQNCAQFKIFITILDHSLQATPLYCAQNHEK